MVDVVWLPSPQEMLRRRLVILSLALGSTFGAAFSISHARGRPLPLGPRVVPKDWPIALHLPADWTHEIKESDEWSGEMVARPRDPTPPMRLIVEHSRRFMGRMPMSVASQYFEREFPGLSESRAEPIAFGPTTGTLVYGRTHALHGAIGISLATASLPDGPSVVLALVSDGPTGARLRNTLRAIAQSVEFVSPALSRSLPPTAAAVGLDVPVPDGAWFVASDSPHRAAHAFISDANQPGTWEVSVWRSASPRPRRLEDLVSDALLSGGLEMSLEEPPTVENIAGRSVAWAQRCHGSLCRVTFAVDLGGDAVGMMAGSCDAVAADALRAVCRDVAARMRPVGDGGYNVATALRLGGDLVRSVRQQGLAAWCLNADDDDWMLYTRHGEPCGYLRTVRLRNSDGRDPGCRVGRYAEIRYESRIRVKVRWDWRFDADGLGFETTAKSQHEVGDETRLLSVTAVRAAGSGSIAVRTQPTSASQERRLDVLDAFVPDPMEDAVLARLADLSPGQHVLLQMSAATMRSAFFVHAWTEPGRGTTRRVWIQSDHEPERTLFQIDADGRTRRITYERGVDFRRSSEDEVGRRLRWYEPEDPAGDES